MKPHPHGSSGLIGAEPAERQEDASEAKYPARYQTFNASHEALAACVCLYGGGMLFL
ncbi:hypothetical protein [Paenibacillus tyrfis]|uniref:hypothetical protein n=1 Tax=Paenibacillus tyrfis TaxID=1501230 RepID=UPI0015C6287C|nr:hypothetical protein [Paenibacillus tyrfis]